MHDAGVRETSPWVRRFMPLVRPGGTVLDVACGGGRHLRAFRARGHPVVGVDRDLSGARDLATDPGVELVEADLETDAPFPLAGRRFAAVVVTRYLHRPLFPALLDALETPDGVLVYETFMVGHARHGRPTNPAFLLRPGELLDLCHPGLSVVAYEAGTVPGARPQVLQRICARVPSPPGTPPGTLPP